MAYNKLVAFAGTTGRIDSIVAGCFRRVQKREAKLEQAKRYTRRFPGDRAAYRAAWAKRNPEKQRQYHINCWATKKLNSLRQRTRISGLEEPDFDRRWLEHKFESVARACEICKKPLLVYPKFSARDDALSIDRVDNLIGYIKSNIAILCNHCNLIKRDGTAEDHQRIADFMKSRGVR